MNGPNQDRRREKPEQLLGGHATGNLSEQEQKELFAAALEDQQLFDALMDEEALREMLEQPGAKRELIEALQPNEGILARFGKWLTTPMGWGAAGAVATTAALTVFFITRLPQPHGEARMAKQEAAPVAAPAPQAAPERTAQAPVAEARKAPRARQPAGETKQAAAPPAERTERDKLENLSRSNQVAQNEPQQRQQQQPMQAIREQQAAQALDQQSQRQDSQQQVQSIGAAATAQAPAPVQKAPPPAAPAPARMRAAIPPVQYTLLKRDEQGNYIPATTFRESDAVRIRVTASQDGYLALTRRGEPKAIVSLTPVRAGETLQLPASGFLLPSSQPYRLEFAQQIPMAPGAGGVIGGFRPSTARVLEDSAAKSKDATPNQPVVIEILIKGTEN